MSLIASIPQTSVLKDITASIDNAEPIDITDEPESVEKQPGRPPSWVKTNCFRVVDVGANRSKRKVCTCLFCQKPVKNERKALEDHIKQDCTKVTREIKVRVSEAVRSSVPDVAPPTAKRQKPTPGKPGHYAALKVPSTSKTTSALERSWTGSLSECWS